MIKSILIAIICLGVLFSVQAAVAEEELLLPEGKNIKEWESAGGIGILHTDAASTINDLKKIGFP